MFFFKNHPVSSFHTFTDLMSFDIYANYSSNFIFLTTTIILHYHYFLFNGEKIILLKRIKKHFFFSFSNDNKSYKCIELIVYLISNAFEKFNKVINVDQNNFFYSCVSSIGSTWVWLFFFFINVITAITIAAITVTIIAMIILSV